MIEKALFRIRKTVEYFTIFMIVLMTVVICLQVVSRFIFNYTPAWIQPLSLLLMVWIGFIGMAVGIQEDSHVKLGLFVSRMPDKIQRVIIKMQRLIAFLFGLFMLCVGFQFSYSMRNSFISGLNIPSAILYAIAPIAGLFILIYILFEFFGIKVDFSKESEEEE